MILIVCTVNAMSINSYFRKKNPKNISQILGDDAEFINLESDQVLMVDGIDEKDIVVDESEVSFDRIVSVSVNEKSVKARFTRFSRSKGTIKIAFSVASDSEEGKIFISELITSETQKVEIKSVLGFDIDSEKYHLVTFDLEFNKERREELLVRMILINFEEEDKNVKKGN